MPLFSTSFAPPAAVTGLSLTADLPTSSVQVRWTATALGVDFLHYDVYRSIDGITWAVATTITNESMPSFDDYEAPVGVPVWYRVTVTNTTEFESDPTDAATELDSTMWWIVTPADTALTFVLAVTTAYDDVRPVREEHYEPLGRGRKLVVFGDLLGAEGTITVDLAPADADRVNDLRSISGMAREFVLLKSPFGDVWRCRIGSVKRSRGTAGRQRVSFPFTEVA